MYGNMHNPSIQNYNQNEDYKKKYKSNNQWLPLTFFVGQFVSVMFFLVKL